MDVTPRRDEEGAQSQSDSDPLSPGERAGVRAVRPSIREASSRGGRGPALPRALRASSTDAEAVLWRHLRNRQLGGAKFRRQQVLGPYVVDFYCHDLGLVIEVDGGQHFEGATRERDLARTAWLEGRGLHVLRLSDRYVLTDAAAVFERILVAIEERRPSPSPTP